MLPIFAKAGMLLGSVGRWLGPLAGITALVGALVGLATVSYQWGASNERGKESYRAVQIEREAHDVVENARREPLPVDADWLRRPSRHRR